MRRWLRRLSVLALALGFAKGVHCGVTAAAPDEAERLAYLARRLDRGELPGVAPGPPFDGEWLLVEHSFTIAAATNLAFRDPSQAQVRRAQVKRWVDAMFADEVRAFDTAKWGEDALRTLEGSNGHVGFLGHLAWALGASCLIGNGAHQRAGELAASLARRFDASPSALLETYPGETYVPDNLVAVAGLALDQRCHGDTRHEPTIHRFVEALRRERLDADTGVLVFAPGQPGRGSGAAWMAYFFTFIDEAFARAQFEALFRAFGVDVPLGAFAVREWPRGVDRPGDVDSGPLVLGLSPSGTGFALAGPAFTGDPARLRAMLRTAEAVGTSGGGAERRYLLAPLVGDAIVLATRTATAWPAPLPRAVDADRR
ncbi:MAG: hypothetical protein JNJ54_24715 [Myxococcaceae bacterium]|nr:hypothetical protein [Myxococcaceae bacterium]